ncbi:MAG: hypothetical protein IPF98_21160 [Gemmatimonadetes bacterium]|nr:hypothetical protein [Gemmatimonadota bacterium]MCC6774079.1 hypothetical protein [Gemmatimonadaceae bacterium]
MTNWDEELKKIDRQLESVSDEALLPSKQAATPEAKAQVLAKQAATSTLGVTLRLLLAVTLGVGMLFWPYSARCGVGLFGYLAATGVVSLAGVWTAVWTWRHRSPKGHVLSLLLIVWGMVLAGVEVLPRTGYAMPTPDHPTVWMCE